MEELYIRNGKIVNRSGEIIMPEIGNPDHIKLLETTQKRKITIKKCCKCGIELGKSPMKVLPALLRLTIRNGRFINLEGKTEPIEFGNPDQIAACKRKTEKKKVQYICPKCIN